MSRKTGTGGRNRATRLNAPGTSADIVADRRGNATRFNDTRTSPRSHDGRRDGGVNR
ncbi:hypothetical protein OG705_08425 [Streptomyces sp. NBC_00838]|uniref:hypothetical protein n=1 Tax=Streptomyces sp. NBC_00838 TaxID=2903680 RepID=UPI00386492AE|nr:hypothetical protein OG705_08425 [Streptomyces sp. NBC_00838]